MEKVVHDFTGCRPPALVGQGLHIPKPPAAVDQDGDLGMAFEGGGSFRTVRLLPASSCSRCGTLSHPTKDGCPDCAIIAAELGRPLDEEEKEEDDDGFGKGKVDPCYFSCRLVFSDCLEVESSAMGVSGAPPECPDCNNYFWAYCGVNH